MISKIESSIAANDVQTPSNYSNLKDLENRLNRTLVGQPDAVKSVSDMIKRVATGFYDSSKPRGVLLFAGPTGVGKTELAKLTASELGVPLHRFDMSEFSETWKLSRLLGPPPGYVGHSQGGALVNLLKRTPNCLVLFDEIEKAHRDIHRIFLQLYDEGRLTDSGGNEVIARQAVFIMTTNLGAQEIYEHLQRNNGGDIEEKLKKICVAHFSSELYNRFTKVVIFRPLSHITEIVEKQLAHLNSDFSRQSLCMTWDRQAVVHLSELKRDARLGAREIHRNINEAVMPLLVNSRIEGKFLHNEAKVHLKIIDGRLSLVVLDVGKAPSLSKQASRTDARSIQESPVVFRDGIVYLDLRTERPLKQFVGMHVCRIADWGMATFPDLIKICGISLHDGITYYVSNFVSRSEKRSENKKLQTLPPHGDDGHWGPVTPMKSGYGFLKNLCKIYAFKDFDGQMEAKRLVKHIFSELGKDCYLSEVEPLTALQKHCLNYSESALTAVKKLQRLIGPFSVKILTNETDLGRSKL